MANFYISEKDWNTLQNYAKYAYDEHQSEIGGMMIAEQDKDSKWKLHKPIILKQEITGSNTVLDKDALSSYYVNVDKKMERKPFQFVWWHSHHTMSVFWSSTDKSAIKEFNNGTMSISLVINLEEEYKLRVNLWKPYKMHKDVDMDIIRESKSSNIPKSIINKVDKLCEKPTYTFGGNWRSNNTGRLYNQNKPNKQLALFQQSINGSTLNKDTELTQIEAKTDDILRDYVISLDWDDYIFRIIHLNEQLRKIQSELRVGICNDQDELFVACQMLPAEHWIHRKSEVFYLEDEIRQYQSSENETNLWNDSFDVTTIEMEEKKNDITEV